MQKLHHKRPIEIQWEFNQSIEHPATTFSVQNSFSIDKTQSQNLE